MKDGQYRKRVGSEGEQLACEYLQSQGYEILARNYRACNGEIDIIARQGKTLVFVEVKTRQRGGFGEPEEWVDERKQRQIGKVASLYLHNQRLEEMDCRFDVVAVDRMTRPVIRHIQDAFWLT